MNPLSALPLVAGPQFRPELLAQPGAGLQPKAIPAEALAGLCPPGEAVPVAKAAGPDSFANVLGKMVQEVNGKQVAADDAVNGLLSGQSTNLHQAMISIEEASVSFQLMVEVRNRLLDSYQELMRMQI